MQGVSCVGMMPAFQNGCISRQSAQFRSPTSCWTPEMSRRRSFLILKNCYNCGAEAVENDSLVPDGPPVVEENFQGSPHGDPPADDQTLADQGGQPVCFERTEHLADRQGYAQKGKTYQQAGSALLEYLRK